MIRKIKIGIGLAVLVVSFSVMVFFQHKRNQAHDLPTILKSGRLAVLTDSSRLGFSTKGDSVLGFQYEVVKAFADTMGLELVVTVENDLNKSMEDLKGGDYDIIANFTPITTEWKKEALFTIPLFTSHQVLVQRVDNDSIHRSKLIKKHRDLANDTVCLPVHSPFKMRLLHLSDEIAAPIHISEMNKSTEQLVRMVALGKIKYTICDEQFVRQLILQYPNIDVSLPIGFEQQQAWAVHVKSPKLLAELNDFLTDFIGSSAYWKIYRKYF